MLQLRTETCPLLADVEFRFMQLPMKLKVKYSEADHVRAADI